MRVAAFATKKVYSLPIYIVAFLRNVCKTINVTPNLIVLLLDANKYCQSVKSVVYCIKIEYYAPKRQMRKSAFNKVLRDNIGDIMKKISLLLLLILALTAVFTACNRAVATEPAIRWETTGEEYVFEVSLADFNLREDATTMFNTYNYNNETYCKDTVIETRTAREVLLGLDEIRPEDARGTYTLTIQPSRDGTSYCDVTSTQVLYLRYKTSQLGEYSCWQQLSALVPSSDEDPFEADANLTTLKSTTVTSVRFANLPTQTPISSSTEVNGFYIGKVHQEVNTYKVSTTYDFSGKRPVATVILNDGEPTEYQLPKNSEGRIIDSNQMLTYIRSLNKKSDNFQDSPTIYVFDPLTHNSYVTYFGFTYNLNLAITDNTRSEGDTKLFTKLNAVGVSVGSNAFMMQYNLPDRLLDSKLDRVFNGSDPVSKFTTVRFRVGYLSFELASYPEDVWEALNVTTEAAEAK